MGDELNHMPGEEPSLENICARFNDIHWHDSKIIEIRVLSVNGQPDEVTFAIRLLTNSVPGRYEWKDAQLTAKDCRILNMDIDLLGKRHCGGDIASAFCESNSGFKERIQEQLTSFDLPQSEDPLSDLLHFRILLIHPGGEINMLARDFDLQFSIPARKDEAGVVEVQ